MRLCRLWVLLFVTFLMPLGARPGAAQSRTASLAGTVVDQTGAAIAGASIAIRREAVGSERHFTGDDQGAFEVDGLLPGDYELSATSPGFTVAVHRVSLDPGDAERLRLTLQVGTLTE